MVFLLRLQCNTEEKDHNTCKPGSNRHKINLITAKLKSILSEKTATNFCGFEKFSAVISIVVAHQKICR